MSALGYGLAVGQAFMDGLVGRVASLETNKADVQSVTAIQTEINTAAPMRGQSKRIAVSGSAGIATWTFDTPFDVIPNVVATAESPAAGAFTNVASVVENSITKTDVQIVVVRVAKSITLPVLATSLLGLVLSVFGFAPAGANVQCLARKP